MSAPERVCAGMMGPGGYSRVVRAGGLYRVYAGRTCDGAELALETSDERRAHEVARARAFIRTAQEVRS